MLWLTARGCTTSAVWGADGGEGDAHLTTAVTDSRPYACARKDRFWLQFLFFTLFLLLAHFNESPLSWILSLLFIGATVGWARATDDGDRARRCGFWWRTLIGVKDILREFFVRRFLGWRLLVSSFLLFHYHSFMINYYRMFCIVFRLFLLSLPSQRCHTYLFLHVNEEETDERRH